MENKGKDSRERLPLRERNRQRVRQRIIAAAMELFSTLGYNQTTVDDIAEKAEVSRATLFNYFPTKDLLLLPFGLEMFRTQIKPRVTQYLDTQPTTIQALRFLFMNVHQHVLSMPDIDRAIKQEFLRPKEIPGHRFANDGFLLSLTEILKYGQMRGEVRADLALERQARYVGVMFFSIFYSMVLGIEIADFESEIEALLTFVQSGLSAQT